MDKERLEEIKKINSRANSAYLNGEPLMEVHDLLDELFIEEHTDWLIFTVEEQQKEIEQLEKDNLTLRNGFESFVRVNDGMIDDYEKLKEKNAKLKSTLEKELHNLNMADAQIVDYRHEIERLKVIEQAYDAMKKAL